MDMKRHDVKLLFGNRVRELRKSRGWSQEEFAHRVGLDRSYVGGVERGERNVSLENICLIAQALGLPTSELFIAWGAGRTPDDPR
ncbi:MAG: helix-turn-helix transcriptional regulator [Paludisphaera borealis]|uniref:helix-turn-helix domain-containing protein n=1 Tax=Paludisphaera borealis TaxID=1387353 RepID=UPI00285101D3|nr:helix-turn-helix transcriptional regulator [Paludisphaera borealis]MDR3617974.1 helix-turn-helix transcriptional regulator [Paludisphaera borealis]